MHAAQKKLSAVSNQLSAFMKTGNIPVLIADS